MPLTCVRAWAPGGLPLPTHSLCERLAGTSAEDRSWRTKWGSGRPSRRWVPGRGFPPPHPNGPNPSPAQPNLTPPQPHPTPPPPHPHPTLPKPHPTSAPPPSHPDPAPDSRIQPRAWLGGPGLDFPSRTGRGRSARGDGGPGHADSPDAALLLGSANGDRWGRWASSRGCTAPPSGAGPSWWCRRCPPSPPGCARCGPARPPRAGARRAVARRRRRGG